VFIVDLLLNNYIINVNFYYLADEFMEYVIHGSLISGVSAVKPYEDFGDVDHTIKELMSL
jgi:hypothetical protein